MKKITLILLLAVFVLPVYSQSILNTLNTGGAFVVRDGSNTYLELSQPTGQVRLLRNLRLENTTTSTSGVILKGADRFLHNFEAAGSDGYNTFLGLYAGNFTMAGTGIYSSHNTGIGVYSLYFLTTGYENTAVGYHTLYSNNTGYENTAVGYQALNANLGGYDNTALGDRALVTNTVGVENTAVGMNSLYENTGGDANTAVGYMALYHNTNALSSYNTAVGTFALNYADGKYNTAVGYSTGLTLTTGSNNTLIGYGANVSSATVSNQITLGNDSVTSLRCAVITITSLSDARDKKNIHDLNLGIDFLMNIKPRIFNWDKREWYKDKKQDGSKMQKTSTAGFIAQELDEVQAKEKAEWLNLVLKDNPDKLEATPGNLLPVMVKAIQDLKVENNELKAKLEKFERMQSVLMSEIEKMKSKDLEVIQAKNAN
jgi:hypothetical protein